MAVKKIQMRPPDNNYADVLHPETDTTMVLLPDGSVLQDQLVAPLASGSATELVIDMPGITNYTHCKLFQFIASANNNGAASTLKIGTLPARPIYLEGTTNTAPTLIAGKLYTVWADNTKNCFFLKASGSGNAVAADLLAGKTATTDNGPITGTMPNNGSQNATLEITGSAKPTKVVPAGYTPGGTITAQLAPSLANIILQGNTVGGVAGALPNNGSQNATLEITGSAKPTKVIPAGYTPGGTITAQLAPSLASKIQDGVTIGGVVGTLVPKVPYPTSTDIDVYFSQFDSSATHTVLTLPSDWSYFTFVSDMSENDYPVSSLYGYNWGKSTLVFGKATLLSQVGGHLSSGRARIYSFTMYRVAFNSARVIGITYHGTSGNCIHYEGPKTITLANHSFTVELDQIHREGSASLKLKGVYYVG